MEIANGNDKKGWAELECVQYIQILNSWPTHAYVCVGAFSEGFAG